MGRRNNRYDSTRRGKFTQGKLRPEEQRFWQEKHESEAAADERKLDKQERRKYGEDYDAA